MKKCIQWGLVLLAVLIVGVPVESSAAANDFFKGKTIRIVCASTPGGVFDTMARVTARFLPKYIPGNPTIIVQNMPGGGGNIAANHVYNIAEPDGLTLLMPLTGMPINPVLGTTGVRYDSTKMAWIGSISRSVYALIIRSDRTYKTLKDLTQAKRPIYVGAMPGTAIFSTTMVVKEVLRLPMEVIRYGGGAEIDVAIERGEVDGRMNTLGALQSRNKEWLERKFVNVFVQIKERRDPAFPDVPTLYELAPEHKLLIDLADFPNAWAGAYATPPGVPEKRVRILRSAFDRMVQDPEFERSLGDYVPLAPSSGEELREKVEQLDATSPEMRKTLRRVWGLD